MDGTGLRNIKISENFHSPLISAGYGKTKSVFKQEPDMDNDIRSETL